MTARQRDRVAEARALVKIAERILDKEVIDEIESADRRQVVINGMGDLNGVARMLGRLR